MAKWKFRRNSSDLRRILQVEFREPTERLAEHIASNARAQLGPRFPVSVRTVTTDRAHVTVAIAHPAGIGLEAKHGVLTKAAAAAGVTVRARRG